MNNLTREQELYYLTHRKSNLITIILSIFLLPIAPIYTRGFGDWLWSLVWLFAFVVTITGFLLLGANDVNFTEIIVNFVAVVSYLVYFLFTVTDARRVNINLRKELLGEQDAI